MKILLPFIVGAILTIFSNLAEAHEIDDIDAQEQQIQEQQVQEFESSQARFNCGTDTYECPPGYSCQITWAAPPYRCVPNRPVTLPINCNPVNAPPKVPGLPQNP